MRALLVLLALCLGTLATWILPAQAARADDSAEVRREFRAAQKNEDWKERRAAYINLLDYDGVNVFEEMLGALLREQNAAVILEGIKTISQLESDEARAAILAALAKPKGRRGQYLLLALSEQKGPGGEDVLIRILRGKDEQLAGLAAIALGRKATEVGVDPLVAALGHKDWHVVSAAARALRHVAWSAWTKPEKKNEKPKPTMPSWFDPKLTLWPLVDALEKAEGRPRADLIEALESITGKDHGDNHAAWVAVADGKEPTPAVLAQRVHPAYFFGIPVYAKRVVVVFDVGVRTLKPHPFSDRRRQRELCAVPGGASIPWSGISTVGDFMAAFTSRFIQDLPPRGVKFELILSGRHPRSVLGRLAAPGDRAKKSALSSLRHVAVENGTDIASAMHTALDIAGPSDSVAMARGPDQVLCVYLSLPHLAAETNVEVVAASVGLKARLRLVPIHAVGVWEHPEYMMRAFAEQSGGRYLSIQK